MTTRSATTLLLTMSAVVELAVPRPATAGGDETYRGGPDNDTLAGDAGLDNLHGDNNVLFGNVGCDQLSGGAGVDVLNGGGSETTVSNS